MRIGIALIMFLLAVNIAFADLPDVQSAAADPKTVEPGQDVSVDVTFYNNLPKETGPFSVIIDAQEPVIFKSSSKDMQSVNLCGGCKVDNTYFLSVATNAISRSYPVYIRMRAGNIESQHQVDIKVRGKPNVIFSTKSQLDNITPGSVFPVVLDVANIGTDQARQIKLQPDSSSFIVLGNPLKVVDALGAGEAKPILFEFVAAESLTANSYTIPFKISFLDYQGATSNATQSLGLRVVNKGGINVQNIKAASSAGGAITTNQPFTVIVRLENTGPGDADTIVADISCPFNGPKKAFLGQLKKDEDAPAVFELTSTSSGNFACDLHVSYKDDTGAHEFTDKFDIAVAQNNPPLLAAAIIILALLYIFRKRILAFLKRK